MLIDLGIPVSLCFLVNIDPFLTNNLVLFVSWF
jgi:hypothetical protein